MSGHDASACPRRFTVLALLCIPEPSGALG
jgi:hypothetical protein